MIYEPAEDSYLLEKEVKRLTSGKKVLDVGCGCGIQSLAAKKSGAKSVLAVDIDEESLISSREKGIEAIKSNLFSNVKGKFDVIIFNPPYLSRDKREDKESAIATTGGKNGDELIFRFIRKSVKFLEDGGFILIVLSSLTPKDKILEIIKKEKMKLKIISREKLFMESIEVWKIKKPLLLNAP